MNDGSSTATSESFLPSESSLSSESSLIAPSSSVDIESTSGGQNEFTSSLSEKGLSTTGNIFNIRRILTSTSSEIALIVLLLVGAVILTTMITLFLFWKLRNSNPRYQYTTEFSSKSVTESTASYGRTLSTEFEKATHLDGIIIQEMIGRGRSFLAVI